MLNYIKANTEPVIALKSQVLKGYSPETLNM